MAEDTDQGHPFKKVPIEITVSVGKAYPKIKDLLSLDNEAVLVLSLIHISEPTRPY